MTKTQTKVDRRVEHTDLCHEAQQLGLGAGTLADLVNEVDWDGTALVLRVLRWYASGGQSGPGGLAVVEASLPRGGSLDGLKRLLAELVRAHYATVKGWLPADDLPLFDGLIQKLLG